jgi:hypothetical protein
MKVTSATMRDSEKQAWITLKDEESGEVITIHVISNEPIEWSHSGFILNIRPKKLPV